MNNAMHGKRYVRTRGEVRTGERGRYSFQKGLQQGMAHAKRITGWMGRAIKGLRGEKGGGNE